LTPQHYVTVIYYEDRRQARDDSVELHAAARDAPTHAFAHAINIYFTQRARVDEEMSYSRVVMYGTMPLTASFPQNDAATSLPRRLAPPPSRELIDAGRHWPMPGSSRVTLAHIN
jgi:hypothetical protein